MRVARLAVFSFHSELELGLSLQYDMQTVSPTLAGRALISEWSVSPSLNIAAMLPVADVDMMSGNNTSTYFSRSLYLARPIYHSEAAVIEAICLCISIACVSHFRVRPSPGPLTGNRVTLACKQMPCAHSD